MEKNVKEHLVEEKLVLLLHHLQVVQQLDELLLYHMLFHIILHITVVLLLLFARCLVLSLGCARTYGPISRRRGKLGERILGL